VKRIVQGSAIAGFVCFAVSLGLFAVVRLTSDDMSGGILLTFIGVPVLVLASLCAGWVAAVRSRRVAGVFGALVSAVAAVLLAGILLSPLHGWNAGTVYLLLAGLAAISTAAGYLICVAGVPDPVDA
jgi:hypothetical protein